jgi:aspartyl protease family protein
MQELPAGLKHVTVWLLIGVALFLGISWWQGQARATRIQVDGGTVEIRRAADGHYHWPGRINGVAVDFLVDTGATATAVPHSLAMQAGLREGTPVSSSTAGGVVSGYVAPADIVLEGGVSALRLPVTVLPALGKPLLGMDIISRMNVSLSDGMLRLQPKEPAPR